MSEKPNKLSDLFDQKLLDMLEDEKRELTAAELGVIRARLKDLGVGPSAEHSDPVKKMHEHMKRRSSNPDLPPLSLTDSDEATRAG